MFTSMSDFKTTLESWDIGDPVWECSCCKAQMWYVERVQKKLKPKNPKFSLCCMQGRIELPHLLPPPQPLKGFTSQKRQEKQILP